ncbi:unnamed protein product [Boreogadus saida]
MQDGPAWNSVPRAAQPCLRLSDCVEAHNSRKLCLSETIVLGGSLPNSLLPFPPLLCRISPLDLQQPKHSAPSLVPVCVSPGRRTVGTEKDETQECSSNTSLATDHEHTLASPDPGFDFSVESTLV